MQGHLVLASAGVEIAVMFVVFCLLFYQLKNSPNSLRLLNGYWLIVAFFFSYVTGIMGVTFTMVLPYSTGICTKSVRNIAGLPSKVAPREEVTYWILQMVF